MSSPRSSDPSEEPGLLGVRLRAERERRGLDIPSAASALRIPVRTLRALEEGTFDDLPAPVYARGFVKLYAEYLGLDPVLAVRAFAAEESRRRPRESEEGAVTRVLRPLRRRRIAMRPRTVTLVGGALCGLVALGYLFVEVRSFTRPPFLEVIEPPGNVEIHEDTITIRGKADPTADVRINGERTFVRSDGMFEETLGVRDGVNTVRVAATSVGGKEQTVTREILVILPAAVSSPASPRPSVRPDPNAPFRLVLTAREEAVWVSLRVDGTATFTGLLLPGSRREATGGTIAVTSGKGSRLLVTIDGEDRGVLADDPGVVRDVVFTRSSVSGTVEQRNPAHP